MVISLLCVLEACKEIKLIFIPSFYYDLKLTSCGYIREVYIEIRNYFNCHYIATDLIKMLYGTIRFDLMV